MKDFNDRVSQIKPPVSRTLTTGKWLARSGNWVIILIVGALVLYILSQIPTRVFGPLETVQIHGNELVSKQTIAAHLGLSDAQSWFDIDPYQLSINLKQLSWIKSVDVRKNFWRGIDVYVTEQRPVAFLRFQGKILLLCKDGLVLDFIKGKTSWNLPVIVNDNLTVIEPGYTILPGLLNGAFQLIELLKNHAVLPLASVSEINVTDPLNIQLVTIPDALTVNLGFDNFDQKLKRLGMASSVIESYKNTTRVVDLRHYEGVVLVKKR